MFAVNRIIIFGCISALAVICLIGCGATVTGNTTEARYRLQRSMMAPVYWEVKVAGMPKKVFDAALLATRDLSLNVTHQRSDELTGIINGSFADQTGFGIKTNYDSPGITRLQITAGTTGNKTLVLQIFKAIEKYL